MFNKKPKQSCANCHFFRKEYQDSKWINSVLEKERELSRSNDFSWRKDHNNIGCYFLVWDEGYNLQKSDIYRVIVETDRKNFCFFWEFTPGMLFPAAEILQKRHAQNKEANQDRRLTVIGLWAAVITIFIDVCVRIVELEGFPF